MLRSLRLRRMRTGGLPVLCARLSGVGRVDERHLLHGIGLGQAQVLADHVVVAGDVGEAGGLVEGPLLDAFDLLAIPSMGYPASYSMRTAIFRKNTFAS
ncbi:hypothetical protein [Streptomyces lasalocidi]|uniref:Uncharacterized protein n=1 Tax=Streptomyces lasalocidi TaxID=324833 RepID=A0A4U5W4D3_STRLS|nr:hypothetical protein [Streptomyces lasalocidi]TKS96257.1 hypothetical protein E4U91_36745 [Streptomyces lasalocidi]